MDCWFNNHIPLSILLLRCLSCESAAKDLSSVMCASITNHDRRQWLYRVDVLLLSQFCQTLLKEQAEN